MNTNRYTVGDHTISHVDGRQLTSIYLDGKAPLQGGGANGVPLGKLLGRVWQADDDTWTSSPYLNPATGQAWHSWQEERDGSTPGFRTRKEACVFLHGMYTQRTMAGTS